MIVVATDEEYVKAKQIFKDEEIIKTGVGGVNVVNKLKDVDKNTPIINFGYCGSLDIPIGTIVTIGECEMLHENATFDSPNYHLNGTHKCYTSNDFVMSTNLKEQCVFDMELAFILALGFQNITSIKIVSDKLNYNEYKENIKND